MPTIYQLFCERWKDGCGSSLCPKARKIGLVRGSLPCDVMFIGEAPSISADVVGRPFVGPTGALLNEIIRQAITVELRFIFTNIVGCVSVDDNRKHAPPPDEALMACRPRVKELIEICDPKLLVAVGTVALRGLTALQAEYESIAPIPLVDIVHPSHILQTQFNGYLVRRAAEKLRNAVAEHVIKAE